jgi:hypothetical protein
MNAELHERFLGRWSCDDGRSVELIRSEEQLMLRVSAASGDLIGTYPARYEAPNEVRASRPGSAPAERMSKICAEVGEGIHAQTYTLYIATRDERPDARFQNREVYDEDATDAVYLIPDSSASWVEINTSDPWSDPDYGMISWAKPLLNYRRDR